MSKAGKRGVKVHKAKQSGKKHAKKHHQSQEAAAHSKDLLDREMSSVYSMMAAAEAKHNTVNPPMVKLPLDERGVDGLLDTINISG